MRFLTALLAFPLLAAPRLLLDPGDIERMRRTAQSEPWAADVLNKLLRDADDWPAAHVRQFGLRDWALPTEGAGWSHAYVCPDHGVRLRQQAGRNLCPVDGKDYHGWPIDHVVFMERNSDNTRAARDLGLAFQLTGKPEYAAKVRRIVNAYTALYPKLPIHDNQNRLDTRTGARVMSQTLSESHWLIPLVHAYDLVRDTLPPAERAAFETNVLRNAAAVIARYDARQSNWQSWHNAALLAVGLAVDDRDLVKLALDGPSGFKFQMRASIQPDGPWYEGAWGYHFYAFDPLALTREMAGRAGIALPEAAALKRMLDAPLAAVFPDGTLPNFNDSGLSRLANSARHYEFGYRLFHDPAYAALVRATPRSLSSLMWDTGALPPAAAAPAPASTLLPDSGIATLRPATGDYTLAVKFGPHGGGHGHFDKLSFISFANGAHQAADPGTQAYAAKTHATWDKESVAHNTVVVDEKTQAGATGRLIEWITRPDFTAIRASAGPVYEGVELERLLIHTPRYTLDVYDVRSTTSAPHKIDWVYHNYGKLTSELALADFFDLPKTAGYQHLTRTRAARTADAWAASFTGLRVTMLGAPDTTVVMGDGLGPDLTVPVPFVMARRQGATTRFVTLLEPYRPGASPSTLRESAPNEYRIQSATRTDTITLESGTVHSITISSGPS